MVYSDACVMQAIKKNCCQENNTDFINYTSYFTLTSSAPKENKEKTVQRLDTPIQARKQYPCLEFKIP